MSVLRGLRQALVLIAGSLAVGALAAVVWVLATGDRFLPAFGVAVVVVAFLVGTAGGTTRPARPPTRSGPSSVRDPSGTPRASAPA